MDGLDFSGRRLDDAEFHGCSFNRARLRGTRLARAVLFCCDLSGADLTEADLTRADLRGHGCAGPRWSMPTCRGPTSASG
ncbi:MAG: pentapeptide repeat-containing protein [Brevundimonas sp.]|nr:MAG: pentapeptide repeat-containing protein [Brevundimonas sp.]